MVFITLCILLSQNVFATEIFYEEKPGISITQQPGEAAAVLGEKVSVSVEAVGDSLKYQWYYRDTGAKNFSRSSIKESTYTITMTEARASREVYCVVTDTYGNRVVTDTATLRLAVNEKLEILTQPVSADAAPGEKATVFVEAKGDALKYQWYYRDAGAKTFTKSTIKENVYSITVKDSNANRVLYCVITDAHGNQVITDTVSMIVVDELAITKQPCDAAAVLGEKVSVSVKAAGYPLKYQWYYRDAGAKNFSRSSIKESTYTLTMTEERANREVYCVITDAYGNTVTSETVRLLLAVNEELEIIKQPVSADSKPGEKATLFVDAKGDALKYQWYFRDVGANDFTKSSIKESVYSITVKDTNANRLVYCVITDAHGNKVTTDIVNLIHVEKLAITKQPVDAAAILGEKVTVSVEATGYPLKYQWYYRDAGGKDFNRSSIKESDYTVIMKEARIGREVYCVITDAYGNKITSDVATLNLKEVITTYYASLGDAFGSAAGSMEPAGAAVKVECSDEETKVILMQDIVLAETLLVDTDCILDLNGHKIISTAMKAIEVNGNVVIDGSADGSGMTASMPEGENALLLQVTEGSLMVNGGTYAVTTTNAGTPSAQAAVMLAKTGTTLTVKDAVVTAVDMENGSVAGIFTEAGTVLEMTDTEVLVSSGESLENHGISAKGDVVLVNCSVIAEADYTANKAGTNYASNSRGIYCEGGLELYDCYVWGAHAGVTAKGSVYVDGGIYDGYGHGAFYLAGTGTTSYFYNATINWAPMRDGTYADLVAGTNGAGFYLGGASNMTAYFDNCKFNAIGGSEYVYKGEEVPFYGIVLRSSGGEKNNSVYVSNSEFVHCNRYAYRIGNSSKDTNLRAYSGIGNDYSGAETVFNYAGRGINTVDSYEKK